jgi:pyrroline-5-carboxylate reductase
MEKFVIIGTGFIGEYMLKGIKHILDPYYKNHVFAVKGSEKNLAKIQEIFNCPVTVANAKEVIERERPTVILLAVPPTVAEDIIKNHICPYLASGGKADIYSFIPSPGRDEILNMLPSFCNVVTILPNIIDSVAGFDLRSYGMNYLTFPQKCKWSPDREKILRDCMSVYGQTVALSHRDSLVLLAGKITSHVMYEVSYTIENVCKNENIPVTVNQVGLAMRYAQYEIFPHMPRVGGAGKNDVPNCLYEFIKIIVENWYAGLHKFSLENIQAIDKERAEKADINSFALNVFPIAHSSRRQLAKDTKGAATKGGILERGIQVYLEIGEKSLEKLVKTTIEDGTPSKNQSADWAKNTAYTISKEAFIRSKILNLNR